MKNIQVYGTGCKGCTVTAERIEQVAKELELNITIEKVTSLEEIMQAGVLSTPGIGIDGTLKHTGSVPSVDQIRTLLA